MKPPRYTPGPAIGMLDVTTELMAGRPIFQGTMIVRPEQAKRMMFHTLEVVAESGKVFRAMDNPEWNSQP